MEPMNSIVISKNAVCIEITGWDRLWSFKGSLTIPRECISNVCKYDRSFKPPWCRCPGTAIPGVIIAGTYYGRGRKEFWSTRFRKGALVFDLKDAEYTRIVVDADNSEAVLYELENKA
jgi:hypothetical protein